MTRPAQPLVFIPAPELFEDEDDGALGARDPLGAQPLTPTEVQSIEREELDVDEPDEGALEALRKASEAKLPFDPSEAVVEAADATLQVRTRSRRRTTRPR